MIIIKRDPRDYLSIYDDDIKEVKRRWAEIKSASINSRYHDFIEERISLMEKYRNTDPNDERIEVADRLLSKEIQVIYNCYLEEGLKLKEMLLHIPRNEKLKYFLQYHDELSDKDFWRYLSGIYTGMDYMRIPKEIFEVTFNSPRSKREFIMDEEERAFFKKLPETFTAYRCMSKEELENKEFGLSWTLSEDVAFTFQERNSMIYGKQHVIYSMTLNKSDTIAYLNGKKEEEILYSPKKSIKKK